MAGTQVRMQRSTLVVEGTNKYQIIATCTIKGDLADTGIFLLNIVTVSDPKDDTLARVIQIADTTTYTTNRDTAILRGNPYWRSNSVTLLFDDIEIANAAWKELSSRINGLVEKVDTYNEEFLTFTEGDVITYPTIDISMVDALKTAYTDAAAAVDVAVEARDAQVVECQKHQTDLDVIEDRLEEAQGDLERTVNIQAGLSTSIITLTTVYSDITSNNTAVRTYNNSSSASPAEKANIESKLGLTDSSLVLFNSTNNALNSLLSGAVASEVNTLRTRITTLTTNKNKTLTELNKCHVQIAMLQGAVDAARATRDSALAAVRAVCSDFVP